MELPWSHVLWDKGDCAFVVITPIVTEYAVLGVHLIEKHCVRFGGENQCKGCLQPIFHDKVNDLIKDLYSVSIKTYNKGTHHSDFAFMKTLDTFSIFSGFIRKLMHMIDVRLGKRFKADIDA
jgi:hypothetical protein